MSNKNKPVLMTHEVCKHFFSGDIILSNYTLTFDDGLLSQYLMLDDLLLIPTEKIFFINTGIIAEYEQMQDATFVSCREAHDYWFETNDAAYYMTWEQIKEISQLSNCKIGGHSHSHIRGNKNIIADTRIMMQEFEKHDIEIDSFCFPYNEELDHYRHVLSTYGIKNFYGAERVNSDELFKPNRRDYYVNNLKCYAEIE